MQRVSREYKSSERQFEYSDIAELFSEYHPFIIPWMLSWNSRIAVVRRMELYITCSASYTVRHRTRSLLHSYITPLLSSRYIKRKSSVTLSCWYSQVHLLLSLSSFFIMQEGITYDWTVHICLKFISDSLRFLSLARYIQISKL